MSKHIAVIGAGIAGLTAAYYLKKYGYKVVIFEASHRVGGKMTTDHINGYAIDRGAQFLSAYYPTLMPMIDELNMRSQLVEILPWLGIVKNRKIRKISPNHFLSPLLSGYFNLKESLQFLSTLQRWKATILALPLDNYAAWKNFDDETAAYFILQEFGEQILEYLIEPQMQRYYYQSPEEVSKIQALMLLNFAIRKGKLLHFKNGMGSLPEKLAAMLNIRLNCPILSINLTNSGKISLASNAGNFYADQVVLATPATIARTLFKSANEIEIKLLQTSYSSTINIGILTNDIWQLPANFRHIYGLLIPRRERQHIAAIAIPGNNKARNTKGIQMNIMLDGFHSIKLLNLSDHEILQMILPEVENYFPGISRSIQVSHFIRWQAAEPISFVGKSSVVNEYQATLSIASKVILAGDYMGFPYTDGAAFTGKWSADFIKHADR